MDDESIIKYFLNIVDNDKDISKGIAAIKTLLLVLEKSNCKIQYIDPNLPIINTLFMSLSFSLHDTGIGEYNQVSNWCLEKKWQANNINC